MPYYTAGTPATALTLARAENIAAELVTIVAAFDKIPPQLELEQDRAAYALDTGVADAYVVALPHPWAAYTTGAALRVKIVNANTGPCTIDVDGLGVKAIKRHDGTDPAADDLPAGSIKELFYTGSVMQVSSGTVPVTGTVAVADGGTGAVTLTNHGVVLGSGTSAVSVTGAGTSGQVLTSNGGAADPTFQAPVLPTKEFIVPIASEGGATFPYVGSVGDFPIGSIADTETSRFVFFVPNDFVTLTDCVVVVIPNTTETIQWDVTTDFGADGESSTANSDSITDATEAVTINTIEEVDVSGALTGIAAGDWVGMKFTSNTTTLKPMALRFKYI